MIRADDSLADAGIRVAVDVIGERRRIADVLLRFDGHRLPAAAVVVGIFQRAVGHVVITDADFSGRVNRDRKLRADVAF